MTRFSVGAGALVLAAAITAGALASVADKTYTSARYHFTVAVPAGWTIRPARANLKPGRFPEGDHPETDSIDGPSNSYTPEIGIAAVKLKPGTTLAAWTKTTIDTIGKQFACLSPSRDTTTVAGEHASKLVYSTCIAWYFINVAIVHHGRGYDIFWISTDTGNVARHPGDRAIFDQALKSFRFTD